MGFLENENVIAAASYENQKFYFSPEYETLPNEIKKDIKVICIIIAQKLLCTFLMCFDPKGNVYFKIIQNEYDFNFDEIGAELDIKKIKSQYKELFKSLKLWYLLYNNK